MTDRERSCAECGKSGGWALYCVACMEKLVQPEQAPVAWMFEDDEDNGHKTFRQTPPSPEAVAYLAKWNRPAWAPLYTAPPQRKPLTDEEISNIWCEVSNTDFVTADTHEFARAIEAKLKEKNA